MDIIEEAVNIAKRQYGDSIKAISYGTNEEFEVVTMATPELEKHGDGFEYLGYLHNKKTGKKFLAEVLLGVENIKGFTNLDFSTLNFKIL